MKPNYDFSKARRGAVITVSGNKDNTILSKETSTRLSTLTANVIKSTRKAKASLNKGLKNVETVLAEIRQVKK